jgi:Cd(II)/Pb(II)-responsive transcriptional regulator
MRIGELATATGVSIEAIRFYEHERLLQAAPRSEGNYRIYGARHVERLGFIRKCRSLDMALEEIRSLLRLRDAPRENCGKVNLLLDEHIGHVAARIRELKALEKELRTLREQCRADHGLQDCAILEELSASALEPARAIRRLHVRGSHS